MGDNQPEVPPEKPQPEDISLFEYLTQADMEQKQAILHTQQVLYGLMEHLGMVKMPPKPYQPLTPEQVTKTIANLRDQFNNQDQGEGQSGGPKHQPHQQK